MAEKEKMEIVVDGITVHNPNVVELRKPVIFEGKEYTEFDLSPLEEWTGQDLIDTQKAYEKATGGTTSPIEALVPESNLEYTMFIAARVTGLPIELFRKLKARDAKQVKAKIILFFNSEV